MASNALKARSPKARRAKQLVSVDDLTGGVDLRRSQTLLPSNRSRTTKNWGIDEQGALTVQAGYTLASTASLGAGRAQGGARVYLAAGAFTLLGWNGAVYKPSDAWVFGSPVFSTVSAVNQLFFPYDRNIVAVFDGTNRPHSSTDGSTWTNMGLDAPSSKAAVSSLSTGGLSSGEYAIAYTYKHRGTASESNPSAESTITISNSSGAITATASPSTDVKANAIVWYARHVSPDGETVLRKVSSGSSVTVVITSSGWTTNDPPSTTNGVPPNGLKFATPWKNRWWAPDGVIGNRLWFTQIFLPQSWPASYFIDIPFEKGDSITALVPLGDTLLVYGQSGIFLVVGQTSLDFEVRPSQGAIAGAFGPRAVGAIEQAQTHVAADGIGSFDGSDRGLEFDIQPAWRDLVTNAGSAALALIATVYDPLNKIFRISVPRVYPTGVTGEWVLDLNRTRENDGAPAWRSTDWDAAFYMPWHGNEATAGNHGRLFFMPTTTGQVFEANSQSAGVNSSNTVATYEGPALTFGEHRARIVDFNMEYEPHGGAMSFEAVVDGISQGVIGLSIGAGAAVVGTAIVGTSAIAGAGRRKAYTPLPLGAYGRTVVTKLTYVGQERAKVFSYSYGIIPDGIPIQMSE